MIKKYNCFITSVNKDFILFNPHSFATAIIDNSEGRSESQALDSLTKSQLKYLHENNILIADDKEAIAMSKYYSDKVKYGRTLTLSDAMTFACNMNCVYCFENHTKNSQLHLPSSERIRLITQLIDLYSEDIDRLDYIFFGGEPLLNLDYVATMCSYITERYPAITIDYSFTSNGTLINENFIDLCNKYSVKEMRITLDGTPEVHNSRRIMKNGQSSYELIISNIEKLCSNTNTRVIINTVLDSDNSGIYLDMFRDLVNRLGEYILSDNPKIVFNIGILCHPLFDTKHTKEKGSSNASADLNFYELSKHLIELGASITSPYYAAHCMNSAEKTFTISPAGDIYKCVTGIGSKRFLLSTHEEFFCDPTKLVKLNIHHIEQSHSLQCLECDYLAMCNGGCKCQHYENGDILCRKYLLDGEMESFLKLLYHGNFTTDGLFRKRSETSRC